MYQDLDGLKSEKTEIKLEIYCDEVWKSESEDGPEWMYLGAVFIPSENKEEVLRDINNLRCVKYKKWKDDETACQCKCGYHSENNTEIHYRELDRSNARYEIAKYWIKYISECKNYPKIYINILGINLSNINVEVFGDKDQIRNIYNRFFRTLLVSGLKYFFKDKKIIVENVFHDKSSMENHPYFPIKSLERIEVEYNKDDIKFKNKEVQFIDSDHRKSKREESHFIQLIDIIVGATRCCLDTPSNNQRKKSIGLLFKPTLKILLDRKKDPYPNNMTAEYYKSKYRGRYQVSFFPKKKIETIESLYFLLDDEKKKQFYFDRKILLKDDVNLKQISNWN